MSVVIKQSISPSKLLMIETLPDDLCHKIVDMTPNPLHLVSKYYKDLNVEIMGKKWVEILTSARTSPSFRRDHPTLCLLVESGATRLQLISHLRKEAEALELNGTDEYRIFLSSLGSKGLLDLDQLIEQTNFNKVNLKHKLWSIFGDLELPRERDYRAWNDTVAGLDQEKRNSITRLKLSKSKLTRIPYEVFQLTRLRHLKLSDNKLFLLPHRFERLTALQTLNLSNNQLTALPQSIGGLTALQKIDLSRNLLTELPQAIGRLTSLQTLNLMGNHLTRLPSEIAGRLTDLERLDLAYNDLQGTPRHVWDLTNPIHLNEYLIILTTLV